MTKCSQCGYGGILYWITTHIYGLYHTCKDKKDITLEEFDYRCGK